MSEKDAANGLANRFLYFFAERRGVVPFPQPTPEPVVNDLVRRAAEIIRWAWQNSTAMRLDGEAKVLYEQFYRSFHRSQRQSGGIERVKQLCERHPPYALRMATLFAITDRTEIVRAEHMRAALAWVRYSADSIRFLFAQGAAARPANEATALGEKILALFSGDAELTRTEISNRLHRKCSAEQLDNAIQPLLMNGQLELDECPRTDSRGPKTKIYRLPSANSAKSAKSGSGSGIATIRTPHISLRSQEVIAPQFAQIASTSPTHESPESLARNHVPPNSLNSPTARIEVDI
jgi:hypothetical protein